MSLFISSSHTHTHTHTHTHSFHHPPPQLDNFDDNGFAWFEKYMTAKAGNPLFDKGMYHSTDLIKELDADLAAGNLPQVSWVSMFGVWWIDMFVNACVLFEAC